MTGLTKELPQSPARLSLESADGVLAAFEWHGVGTTIVMLPGAGGNAMLFADLAGELAPWHCLH